MKNRFLLSTLFLGLFLCFSSSSSAAIESDEFEVSFVVEEGSELVSATIKNDMWEDISNPSILPSGSLYFFTVSLTVDDNVDLVVLKNGAEISLQFDPMDQVFYCEDFLSEKTTYVVRAQIDLTGLGTVKCEDLRFDRASSLLYVGDASYVKVYDLTGRIVGEASDTSVLQLSELPDGLYIAEADGKTLKFTK